MSRASFLKQVSRLDVNLRSGEFYGPNGSSANLELLSRFFKKYPDYVNKTFLSVKVSLLSFSILPKLRLRISVREVTSREE